MRVADLPLQMLELDDSGLMRDGEIVIDDLAVHFSRLEAFPAITVKARGHALTVVRGIGIAFALKRLGREHVQAAFDERDSETTALLRSRGIRSEAVTLEDLEKPDEPVAMSLRFARPLQESDASRATDTVTKSLNSSLVGTLDIRGDWLFFAVSIDSRDHHGGIVLAECLARLSRDVVLIATYNGNLFGPLEAVLNDEVR